MSSSPPDAHYLVFSQESVTTLPTSVFMALVLHGKESANYVISFLTVGNT